MNIRNNIYLFISNRLLASKSGEAVFAPIVRIALIGIIIGVSIILLSVFITYGFKTEITKKISAIESEITLDSGNNTDIIASKITFQSELQHRLKQIDGVREISPYILKIGVARKNGEVRSVMLKGISSHYAMQKFSNYLKEGELPIYEKHTKSNDILISSTIADKLNVKVGDRIRLDFIQEPMRIRMFNIKGIYSSGIKDVDDFMLICDLKHLQKLNAWSQNEYGAVGIYLKDGVSEDIVLENLYLAISESTNSGSFRLQTVKDMYPEIFEWLQLIDENLWVIMILIAIVCGFNMVSGLIIIILDKRMMIGVMRAIGCSGLKLRRIFLYVGLIIVGRGLIIGNIIAISIAAIQSIFSIISLDSELYYIDKIPIIIPWGTWIIVNISIVIVSMLMLILPTLIASKMSPIKIIRFN